MMSIAQLFFYVSAAVAVISGFMVVISKNPVRAVLFLVLAFFATAGIWMLLEAEFLALILVLVYVGAVMTLFLFVVMMLHIDWIVHRKAFVRYLPVGLCVALLTVGLSIRMLGPSHFNLANVAAPAAKPADYSNIADLGAVLYTDYAYPFEIAALLLLTAIIAAISLTHRRPKGRKQQEVSAQIAVRRQDRVHLIKMPSEKKR